VTEREIFDCLKFKFGGNDYALLPQVRSTTGVGAARTADAIAVSLWPSRGIQVHGFEFKDSRSDWLSELKKPAKADEIATMCHFWWVVFSSEKCFKADEVPAPWGILVCDEKLVDLGGAKSVRQVRKATLNPEPVPPSWTFLAAVMRRAAAEAASEDLIAAAVRKAVADERTRAANEVSAARDRGRIEGRKLYEELAATVKKFEQDSGIVISNRWESRRIGSAVKLVVDGGLEAKIHEIERMKTGCERLAIEMSAVLGEISKQSEKPS